MRVGLVMPQYRIDVAEPGDLRDAMVAAAVAADAGGVDSVWISDHPFAVGPDGTISGALEPLVSMATLLRNTSFVRVGSLVLAATMRTPAIVASFARTVASVASGRLVVGVGAGWYEPEHRAFGVTLPPYRDRVELASATLRSLPGVRRLVGGSGSRLLRLAANHGDEWNVSWDLPAERFESLSRRLDAECERAGREPSSLARSAGLTLAVGESTADIERAVERLRGRADFLSGVSVGALAEKIIVGSPEMCAERISAYRADEIILAPLLRDDAEMRSVIIERLAPLLR